MKELETATIIPFGEYVPLITSPKLILHGITQDSFIDIVFYLEGKPLYRFNKFQVFKDCLNVFSWDDKHEVRKDALVVDSFAVFSPLRMDMKWELSYKTHLFT